MIKVAICDDDIATTGKIEDMLVPHSKEKLYSDRNRSVLGRRASVRGSREYEQL